MDIIFFNVETLFTSCGKMRIEDSEIWFVYNIQYNRYKRLVKCLHEEVFVKNPVELSG